MTISAKPSPATSTTEMAAVLAGVNRHDVSALLNYVACVTYKHRPELPEEHLAYRIIFGPCPEVTGARVSNAPNLEEFTVTFGDDESWDCLRVDWNDSSDKLFLEWGSGDSYRRMDLPFEQISKYDFPFLSAVSTLSKEGQEALLSSAAEGFERIKYANGLFDHPGYLSALTEKVAGRDLHSLFLEDQQWLAEYAAFLGRLLHECTDRNAVFSQGYQSLISHGVNEDTLKQLLKSDLDWVGQGFELDPSALTAETLSQAGFTKLEAAWMILKQSTLHNKPMESLENALLLCADAGEPMQDLLESQHLSLICRRPGVGLDLTSLKAEVRSRLLSSRCADKLASPSEAPAYSGRSL